MKMGYHLSFFMFLCLVILQYHVNGDEAMLGVDPTHGFISLPLNSSNFHIHSPYNLAVSERYSFMSGIHKLWVLSSDKPLSQGSPTLPRTEVRIRVGVPARSSRPKFSAERSSTTIIPTRKPCTWI